MFIRLDPKHGVNPSISTCFYCGGDKNELVLFGMLGSNLRKALNCDEAPRKVCMDKEPCDKCKGYMKQGIIFIGITKESTAANIVLSGRYCVIKDKAVEKMGICDDLLKVILEKRITYIDDESWDELGFPTEDIPYCSGI